MYDFPSSRISESPYLYSHRSQVELKTTLAVSPAHPVSQLSNTSIQVKAGAIPAVTATKSLKQQKVPSSIMSDLLVFLRNPRLGFSQLLSWGTPFFEKSYVLLVIISYTKKWLSFWPVTHSDSLSTLPHPLPIPLPCLFTGLLLSCHLSLFLFLVFTYKKIHAFFFPVLRIELRAFRLTCISRSLLKYHFEI